MSSPTRREALIAITAAAGAPVLDAQHQHPEEAPAPSVAYRPQTLTAAEMEKAARLCDVIIPRTDTPGASDAGVPEFIDRRLTASASLTASFRRGMSLLDAEANTKYSADFANLTSERQIELLTAISNAPDTDLGRFFRLAKDMTIDGYYSSRAGLVEELGWHGNTFLSEFKGCTHPEHQA